MTEPNAPRVSDARDWPDAGTEVQLIDGKGLPVEDQLAILHKFQVASTKLRDSRARIRELEAALRLLVDRCTPDPIPLDGGKIYGVRCPEREIVDEARSLLEAGASRGILKSAPPPRGET